MVNYLSPSKSLDSNRKLQEEEVKLIQERYRKLASLGKISVGIMNEICGPIDSVNRFINLTLQTIDENSQGREFLLESKEAIRKTSVLLKRLSNYAKKIEKEIREISTCSR